jgi:hypothetical protein
MNNTIVKFRDNKYPFMTTPIGGSFKMVALMGAPTFKKLKALGLSYSQHKMSNGKILAVRTA